VAGSSAAGRRWTMRDTLVALQMAITLVLLVTAGLLTRSLVAAQHAGIGFRPDGVALVGTELGMIGYTPERSREFYDRALTRVRALPGVVSAGLVERAPLSINYTRNRLFFPDRHQGDDKGSEVDATTASPEYFETLGVSILQGRNFAAGDTVDSPGVVIVNQAFARQFWPGESALGKRVRRTTADGKAFQVVGIVADYKVNSVGENATPYVHYAYSQRPDMGECVIARTRGEASALVDAIRRELLDMDPNLLFLDNQTMTTQVGATLLPAKFGALSVSAVGVIAMLLAAIGLYGVIAYSVARRTREIGIRMALGAKPGRVLRLIMRQGLTVAAVGAAGGSLLALGAAKAVSGALYGVSPIDPVAWAGALGTLLAVSVLANAVPARRASRVDPSVALRSE
jgi:predicted permease